MTAAPSRRALARADTLPAIAGVSEPHSVGPLRTLSKAATEWRSPAPGGRPGGHILKMGNAEETIADLQ
jgi:hypothetical protein